jgi:uncharacterized RDD family membrane protein YckC
LATVGERLAAFMVDGAIMLFTLIALAIGAALIGLGVGEAFGGILAMLGFFALRNFYFLGFELRWGGRTPGKRALGLRVVDSDGGPLGPEAVIARNLAREFELWVPIYLLFGSDGLWPGAGWWVQIMAGLWVVALLCLPFTNRERRRLGDLIGGTIVIVPPREKLESDIAVSRPPRIRQTPIRLVFTPAHLSHYGVYELQVLEDLLRRPGGPGREAARAVATKIKTRIAWPTAQWNVDDRVFLSDFYAAQRAELERKLQFGKRKAHKHDV